jgi:type I restriction-modification system DNA methylase subunit
MRRIKKWFDLSNEDISKLKVSCDFQTPLNVAEYMCSLVPEGTRSVLEPTPGLGNIVKFLSDYDVTAPEDFFKIDKSKFDCIVMNPPFSSRYAYGMPDNQKQSGMKIGYYILTECMKMSDNIIALVPWFTLSDSDLRLRHIKTFGLKSIIALPRITFEYVRIQTCIIELQKGYTSETTFKLFADVCQNQNYSTSANKRTYSKNYKKKKDQQLLFKDLHHEN